MADDATLNKHKVTMVNVVFSGFDAKGRETFQRHEAVDFVPEEILEAYVADARTRWHSVDVEDGLDDGPGGAESELTVPDGLDHELAGKKLAAAPNEGN